MATTGHCEQLRVRHVRWIDLDAFGAQPLKVAFERMPNHYVYGAQHLSDRVDRSDERQHLTDYKQKVIPVVGYKPTCGRHIQALD